MCWTIERSDVSWASVSINTKYRIVKITNKILSVTGKIADNKLENVITERVYPACNRIMWNFLHITCCLACGVFMYLFLPSISLPSVFLSEQVDIGYDVFESPHIWFTTILWQDRAIIWLWNCWFWVPLFEWKSEAGDVRRRNCLVGWTAECYLSKGDSIPAVNKGFLVRWGRFQPVPVYWFGQI